MAHIPCKMTRELINHVYYVDVILIMVKSGIIDQAINKKGQMTYLFDNEQKMSHGGDIQKKAHNIGLWNIEVAA